MEKIIEEMRHAAPAGQAAPDDGQIARLRELTAELLEARPGATAEYARFLSIAGRGLSLPEDALRERLRGARVLVTGGTGCIGSALVHQLAERGAQVHVISRGESAGWPRHPLATYWTLDVRDSAAITAFVKASKPDVIFHCAAQRSPALAEAEVRRTVMTNTLGARNVLAAAGEAGVPQVVLASTGKALRPYSPEVYTASKRAAEWLGTTMTGRGMLVSAARFTHVIDNSIVHARMLGEATRGDAGLIRLHSPDIAFYAQSALESAHLLLASFLGAAEGEFRVHAIRDLGWPASLLDVALGTLRATGSRTPLWISGYDPGYEEAAFPGLYDPRTAGDVSPLINAFEAERLTDSPCEQVDAFRLEMGKEFRAVSRLERLAAACQGLDEAGVRDALDVLSWELLDSALARADVESLARCLRLASRHSESMTTVHRRIALAIRASIAQCR